MIQRHKTAHLIIVFRLFQKSVEAHCYVAHGVLLYERIGDWLWCCSVSFGCGAVCRIADAAAPGVCSHAATVYRTVQYYGSCV